MQPPLTDQPSFWTLAGRSGSMRIGAGLVGLGLLFVIFVGLDAIQGRPASNGDAMLWTAAFWALVGSVLVATGARRERARWGVLEGGLSTEATVTAVTETRMQTWKREAPPWRIRYRYHDNGGQVREGQSWDLAQEEVEGWKVGDTAMIRFDSGRPNTSAWVGERLGSPDGASAGAHHDRGFAMRARKE